MGDSIKLSVEILIGALLALLLVGTFSGGMLGGVGQMMGGSMMGGGSLGMLFGFILWVLVLALATTLIVLIIRQSQSRYVSESH